MSFQPPLYVRFESCAMFFSSYWLPQLQRTMVDLFVSSPCLAEAFQAVFTVLERKSHRDRCSHLMPPTIPFHLYLIKFILFILFIHFPFTLYLIPLLKYFLINSSPFLALLKGPKRAKNRDDKRDDRAFFGPKNHSRARCRIKNGVFFKIKRFTERKRPIAPGRKSASSRTFLDFPVFYIQNAHEMTR